jgi:hypothetical protein
MSANTPDEAPSATWVNSTLPVFSMVGAVGYLISMAFNWAPFIYYPVVNEIHATEQADLGPGMFWYGWIAYAAIFAFGVSLLALLLPARAGRALSERFAWCLWVTPLAVILTIVFLMRRTLFA